MNSVELILKICKDRKIPISRLEKELGYGNVYIKQLRKGTVPSDRAVEIANYLQIDLQYLLSGGEPTSQTTELTAKDDKDITKTLNKVMEQFENNENGPLYYDGEEIDETSRILIRNAFEYIIRETKKENKVKYNPNKNKTEK